MVCAHYYAQIGRASLFDRWLAWTLGALPTEAWLFVVPNWGQYLIWWSGAPHLKQAPVAFQQAPPWFQPQIPHAAGVVTLGNPVGILDPILCCLRNPLLEWPPLSDLWENPTDVCLSRGLFCPEYSPENPFFCCLYPWSCLCSCSNLVTVFTSFENSVNWWATRNIFNSLFNPCSNLLHFSSSVAINAG